MKYIVKIIVVTLISLFCTYAIAEQKVVFLDMKFILNNSKAGKEAQDFLKAKLKSSQKQFKNAETELKEIEKVIPIYFLDNWLKEDSDILNEFDYIIDRTIPLMDDGGNYHIKWNDWEKNIEGYEILDNFPKTLNNHPSLKSHKLIASSIINFLDKKNIKILKEYI